MLFEMTDWTLDYRGNDAWQFGEDPLTFRKQLIFAGRHRKGLSGPDGKRKVMEFEIDDDTLDHWVKTGQTMRELGVTIPLADGHSERAADRRGQIHRFEKGVDSAGRPALYAVGRFDSPEAAKVHRNNDVSLYSPVSRDYGDRVLSRPITHVALTDYPVIRGMDKFESVALSLSLSLAEELPFKKKKKKGKPEDDDELPTVEGEEEGEEEDEDDLEPAEGMEGKLSKLMGDAPDGDDEEEEGEEEDAPIPKSEGKLTADSEKPPASGEGDLLSKIMGGGPSGDGEPEEKGPKGLAPGGRRGGDPGRMKEKGAMGIKKKTRAMVKAIVREGFSVREIADELGIEKTALMDNTDPDILEMLEAEFEDDVPSLDDDGSRAGNGEMQPGPMNMPEGDESDAPASFSMEQFDEIDRFGRMFANKIGEPTVAAVDSHDRVFILALSDVARSGLEAYFEFKPSAE
jgi:hypothetical protein